MISKYGIVCEVAAKGSFSVAAEALGYAQSSISQAVKAVEDELGVTLLDRKRHGITWTADGMEYAPFLNAIYTAERALAQKHQEMAGLENTTIRIGTFTSVSRDILPRLMQQFKAEYPQVSFELHQGDYNNIHDWLQSGYVDLGFLSMEVQGELMTDFLYEDEMLAVLPKEHPLGKNSEIELAQLAAEPFILLDEGAYSTPLYAFHQQNLSPKVEYTVYDDYSILSMVKNQLGVSLLFRNVVAGFEESVAVRAVVPPIRRKICMAYRDAKTLPYAANRFRKYVIGALQTELNPE